AIGGLRLHHFYAGAVWIEEVDLALAVYSNFHGAGRAGCWIFSRSHDFKYFLHIRCLETHVMRRQPAVRRWQRLVQHELNVVLTIGNGEVHPTELLSVAAAAPGFAQA